LARFQVEEEKRILEERLGLEKEKKRKERKSLKNNDC